MASKVTADEINAFYRAEFPGGAAADRIVEVRENYARLRFAVDANNIRPGGYISGPTQMGLADSAAYAAIFTRLGIVPMAVTSTLTINFLRPCIGDAVIAEAHLIKLGRSLAVIEVEIRAEGSDKLASHAVVNYAIPPDAARP